MAEASVKGADLLIERSFGVHHLAQGYFNMQLEDSWIEPLHYVLSHCCTILM